MISLQEELKAEREANASAQASHESHVTSLQDELESEREANASAKASHASHVTSLQEELKAEQEGKAWEIRELEATYQDQIRKLSTEHAQKV